MISIARLLRRGNAVSSGLHTTARFYSLESPRGRLDPLHLPDSFLGLEERPVEIDKEVFQQYKCYPSIADVGFIKHMTLVLRGGAITWWEAAGILKKFEVKLQAFHICEILRKNIDADAAMGLFRWAQAQPGFQHDTNSYNLMLKTLGLNQRFRQLNLLLKEMMASNTQRTYVTFMAVVQSYFDAFMVDKAVQSFLEFESYVKRKPKKKYYLYVLKKLIECQRSDVLPVIVRGMLQVGHVADTETVNAVIHALSSTGRVGEAVDLSRHMVEKGCAPDVHSYIYLISGLVRSENMDRAPDIIADMAARGCKPNVHNFNLLLEFLLSSDKACEALGVVKRMVVAGCCELQEASNKIIMKFLEEKGDANLASDFYEDLAVSDRMVYNGLLRLLNGAGQYEKALRLYEDMRKDAGCAPDIETKNIVIQMLCKEGKTDEALELFQGLKSSRIKPNKATFDVLLVGLAVNDKLLDCLQVIKKMDKKGFAPEEATYACVIEAFTVGGLYDQAFRLYGRMKLEGMDLSLELQNQMLMRRRRSLEAKRSG
ncbi:pentatricopeptide repeat-containing protein At1g09900-like [Selaginella moellendorffii]|uniref:pentatricopeptide repeat-containing protein At1g09900-like n=1 Tax=Selaginella moellendorffii TaxID=88036 RepID=UPI000D1C8E8D|nr:pentatricopeptide repeat-containing protein At1g09900-like [Selaginella moellendorffii]XP_024530045.1 pentatricopeptide repeat-containing protein At1g09900-like [Selaginella moellendorffii]XP_024530046.1 pentatricopeptide repeat-containing protein At1g09900-like [Selaginella moellendorffii]XP_024530047.1 pentatricopeptide repeat-containing protein At1g09900-like [Selaginella moellendorffii]|eukprot:XP_024530044.1 pentatricopeptide repeat-containing protein At1g09900-like [Selaginella moellendorffii]